MLPFAEEVQLSDTVGILKLMIPGHDITVSAGQPAISGGVESSMETLKVQTDVFPDPSVAWKVFVVIPFGKKEPETSPEVCTIVK